MSKKLHKTIVALLPSIALLTGCVDDNYDLSDIDTTSRINVNNLVLPVNIDPVKLGEVIKIDPGSTIQTVNINGQQFYALVQDGDFQSQDVKIGSVSATPSPIEQTREPLYRLIEGDQASRKAPAGEYVFPINEVGNYFSYNCLNIDEAIVKLDNVKTEPFKFLLSLQIEDHGSAIRSMTFTDMVIRAPKGLDATPSVGTYESATGLWRIPSVAVESNRAAVTLTATGINTDQAGVSIRDDRSLDFNSEFHIQSGYVHIVPNTTTFKDEVTLLVDYDFSDFVVKSFSGKVHYDVEGINIDPISLNGIPDFLKGTDTNIEIANPQIYLQLNNPMSSVGLECGTGLLLTAERDGLPSLDFKTDSPIEIGSSKSGTAPWNFVLSPSENNLNVPDGFSDGLKWHQFSTLGSVLATPASWTTRGLPNKIKVNLLNPGIPVQQVTDFAIPQNFPKVNGKYEVVAPIALNDGSHIVYTEVRDGWNDEDVDAITVTALEVTAHAVNACPVSVQLTLLPIDVDGNTIDAKVESNTIPANSEQDLVITLSGEVRHLDGIRIQAVLEGSQNSTPLDKDQTLTLDNIRAKVNGYYEKEF